MSPAGAATASESRGLSLKRLRRGGGGNPVPGAGDAADQPSASQTERGIDTRGLSLRAFAARGVLINTGFDLIVPAKIERTPAPDSEELFVLRRAVDTTGVLARKFPWPKAN